MTTDPLSPIPAPPLDLSRFENPPDTETALLELARLAAQQTSPLRVVLCEAAAKSLRCSAKTFTALVKAERKVLDAQASEERARLAEEAGRKAVAVGGEAALYFDGDHYYRMENDSRYGRLQRADALMHLKCHGFRHSAQEGDATPAERALMDVQKDNRVTYAGPLCGRTCGLHEANGTRVLCVDSPAFIEGTQGEHPTINALLSGLLGAGRDETFNMQRALFVQWLRLAREAMRNPDRHLPGHVMVIVGPPDCGKSLLQKYVITPAMGGRVAKPNLWLSGATSFNDDLWGAEHLMIDDLTDVRSDYARNTIRDMLKEMVAATDYPLHPKGRRGRTFRPIWRISLTANDDPESVSHIPGLDGGFSDKLILLRAYRPPVSLWDDSDPRGRELFEAKLRDEMASFLYEVDSTECPADIYKARFGVTEWHHPEITQVVESADPLQYVEEALKEFIRLKSIANGDDVIRGEIRASASDIWNYMEQENKGLRHSGVCKSTSDLGRKLRGLLSTPRWKERMRLGKSDGDQYYAFKVVQIPDSK